MNNVVGFKDDPTERLANWRTMIMLKGSLKYMREKNDGRFNIAIDKETSLFQQFLQEYLGHEISRDGGERLVKDAA